MTREEHKAAGELLVQFDAWEAVSYSLEADHQHPLWDGSLPHDAIRHMPKGAIADILLLDALRAYADRQKAAALEALRWLGVTAEYDEPAPAEET